MTVGELARVLSKRQSLSVWIESDIGEPREASFSGDASTLLLTKPFHSLLEAEVEEAYAVAGTIQVVAKEAKGI